LTPSQSYGIYYLKNMVKREKYSCQACDYAPCRCLPDASRTVEGSKPFMSQPRHKRERSRSRVEAVFIRALLPGLNSTEREEKQ